MVGTSGCGSSGLAQCQPYGAGHLACDLHRTQGRNSNRPHEAALTMSNTNFARCVPPLPTRVMTPLLALLFAVAVGVIVLPLYAAQPLISSIAASFGLSPSAMGLTATMPMVGYAAGLLLLVPLIDLLEMRRHILTTLLVGAAALAAAALAPSSPFFLLAALAFGASASAIQMLVPAAAGMVPEPQRGQVIGNIMSGLMMGILLSRPLASLAAVVFGWRGSYALDAVATAGTVIVLYRFLPHRKPAIQFETYGALIASLWKLLVKEAVLRRRV